MIESRVDKKNPIRERSGSGGEKEIWERLRWRRPEWVKPNSHKGMMERESDLIRVNRISAVVSERVVRRRMVMMTWSGAIWYLFR